MKPTNPPEGALKRLNNEIMKITLLTGAFTSLTHYNLVHKLLPMGQETKILDAKAAVDKEWDKLKNPPPPLGSHFRVQEQEREPVRTSERQRETEISSLNLAARGVSMSGMRGCGHVFSKTFGMTKTSGPC